MKKIKMLYDVRVLEEWYSKSPSRSGLYFVALNVLSEFLKNQEFDVILYTCFERYRCIQNFCKYYFPNQNVKILIYNFDDNVIYRNYKFIKIKREQYKRHNLKLKKIFMQLLLIIFSLLMKLTRIYYENVKKKEFKNYDCFFSPFYEIPDSIKKIKKIKKFTILHDMIPVLFSNFHWCLVDKCFIKFLKSLNNNDFYFAVSEYTRKDFLKYCQKINPKNIETTYNACAEYFQPQDIEKITEVKQKYNIPADKKYIFSLFSIGPRKNLVRNIKTFNKFINDNNIDDLVFVAGGGQWDKLPKELEKEISELKKSNKIIFTGYIQDNDLPALYSGAEWFVFTSAYEGFGLPILEAMSCSCPVITASNSSMPEIIQDAGIIIDWDNDEQHINAYKEYYYSREKRQIAKEKGFLRAKDFSWQKTAEQMIATIKRECK